MDCSLHTYIHTCLLDSLNVMRHTGICSVHFEGDPGLTKPNPVNSIFAFPRHPQRKLRKVDIESRERETPQTSKNKMFTSRKRQDVKPELMDHVQFPGPVLLERVGIRNSFTFRFQLGRNIRLVSLFVSGFDGKFMSFYGH